MWPDLFGLSDGQATYLAAALFGAAVIRGYSGFGFSAIFIASAALVTNPLPLIPVVFACEIAMTAVQAREIRPHIDWPRSGMLLAGAALAIVPAVALITRLGENAARLTVSTLILLVSLLLLSGWRLRHPVRHGGHLAIGMVSGAANGAGVGGLPTAAFLSAQPIPPAQFRATMIVFLTGIDVMTLPVMAAHGLTGPDTLPAALLAFPVLLAGILTGTRLFRFATPERFRRGVTWLLVALATLNLARGGLG